MLTLDGVLRPSSVSVRSIHSESLIVQASPPARGRVPEFAPLIPAPGNGGATAAPVLTAQLLNAHVCTLRSHTSLMKIVRELGTLYAAFLR